MLKGIKYKLSEVPQSYWDFVHKYGTIYQSKPYLECLAASGRELIIISVFEDDKLIGGTGITIGRKIFNFPINITTYFGPVVKDHQKTATVLKCIADTIKNMCLSFFVTVLPEHAEILGEDCEFANWQREEIEFLHWDISGSLESLRKAAGKGKKSGVNRARKEGVIIEEIQTRRQVKQFFEVYSMSMGKSGLNPGSQLYYKKLTSMLRPAGLATGFLALHPQTRKPVAGRMLLMGMHREATFLASGHDPQYRKLRGTDLLVWHCVQFLKSKGFTVIDFVGLPKDNSSRAQGLRDSKLAWAGINGHRYPSFILTRGNFGLNPQLVGKATIFSKKIIRLILKRPR